MHDPFLMLYILGKLYLSSFFGFALSKTVKDNCSNNIYPGNTVSEGIFGRRQVTRLYGRVLRAFGILGI
jgi:hypothetical protein